MKKWRKLTGIVLAALFSLALPLTTIEILGDKPMGLFAGTRPEGLGYLDGRFKPPSWKPNCVSSTIEKSDSHYIAPIAFSGDAVAAWKKLFAIVKAQERASVVTEKPDYLYAEFQSKLMGYVDDVEFALDGKNNAIQVRSSSRLGISDRGVNRARIEKIRGEFSP